MLQRTHTPDSASRVNKPLNSAIRENQFQFIAISLTKYPLQRCTLLYEKGFHRESIVNYRLSARAHFTNLLNEKARFVSTDLVTRITSSVDERVPGRVFEKKKGKGFREKEKKKICVKKVRHNPRHRCNMLATFINKHLKLLENSSFGILFNSRVTLACQWIFIWFNTMRLFPFSIIHMKDRLHIKGGCYENVEGIEAVCDTRIEENSERKIS